MKQVIGLSAALAAAMVASYLTWTTEDVPETEGTAVYQATVDELASITFTSERQTVVLTRTSDARGTYFWIDHTEQRTEKAPAPPAPEPATEGADPAAAPPEGAPPEGTPPEGTPPDAEGAAPEAPAEVTRTVKVQFLGNDEAEQLWAAYAPLEALRKLPSDGSIPMSTYGLDAATSTLTVARSGEPVALTIGGETFGSKDRYAKLGDAIYLLDDGDLRPLEFAATRLVERNLYPQGEPEIATIQVSFDGRSVELVQQNAGDKTQAAWARKGPEGEKVDDEAGTWVAKLLKMKLRAYVTDAAARDLQPVFSFVVTGAHGDAPSAAWAVDVLRGVDAETGAPKLYARPEYNRSLVELTDSIAKGVIDDLPALLSE